MTSNIINLTPHEVKVVRPNGELLMSFPPSGNIARCEEIATVSNNWGGIPLYHVAYGNVTGLPEQVLGDCPYCGNIGGVSQNDSICSDHEPATKVAPTYIVSAIVKAALPKRLDLLSPRDFVRDAKGNIVGCKGFIESLT